MTIHSPEELIEDIRQGKMIILMDDEDRENEGDLIMAADFITPEAVNFMATHGRGLICLTMTKEQCEHLGLGPMVHNGDNGSQFGTNFTVSIEAATGVTTGISAADRATTIRAAVAPNATAADLVQPGHIFPLAAQDGGVLVRAGHTEAGCDLTRLAGLCPSAVIVEILKDDGSMARRADLELFAEKHQLKLGTVADLIEYRSLNETSIERITECKLPTEFGEFDLITYQDSISNQLHYALIKGEVCPHSSLVRVHLENHFKDVLNSQREGTATWSLRKSMQRIAEYGGVLVILGQELSQQQTLQQLMHYAEQDQGEPKRQNKPQGTSRQIGFGSQILADLGIKSMRLLSSPDRHYHSLGGFGLSIVEYIES